jgi:putative tryptophan/tyrosine transport system substrate-binding protein
MKRRAFITLLGGAAAWPLAARAQQPERVRRIGIFWGLRENDPEGIRWLSGFTRPFQELGWTDGQNVRMDVRWSGSNAERERTFAKELVNLQPDVILAHGTPVTAALQRETRTIPIVFGAVADPVGAGFVASLSRPSGNITGFLFAEAEMGGKWLELLKEIAPGVKQAAMIFNPDTAPARGSYYLPSFEAAAPSLKVEPVALPVRSEAEIETAINSLGRESGTGFVVMPDSFMISHREPIILSAARNNVPAVYFHATFARDGGLLSYGPDYVDMFRRAAPYVDCILRGTRPEELPVQVPTKFESVVNLKTAKALGLHVPLRLEQLADEVIE